MSIRPHWPAPGRRLLPSSTPQQLTTRLLDSIQYFVSGPGAVIIICENSLGERKKISNKMKSKVKWPQELNLRQSRGHLLPVISCTDGRAGASEDAGAFGDDWRFLELGASTWQCPYEKSLLLCLPSRGNLFIPYHRVLLKLKEKSMCRSRKIRIRN